MMVDKTEFFVYHLNQLCRSSPVEPTAPGRPSVEQALAVSSLSGDANAGPPKVLTTPAVRRLLSENHIDASKIRATGPMGRLLKGDVIAYLNGTSHAANKPQPKQKGPSAAAVAAEAPTTVDHVEVLKGVRKIMFKSMTNSLVNTKHARRPCLNV